MGCRPNRPRPGQTSSARSEWLPRSSAPHEYADIAGSSFNLKNVFPSGVSLYRSWRLEASVSLDDIKRYRCTGPLAMSGGRVDVRYTGPGPRRGARGQPIINLRSRALCAEALTQSSSLVRHGSPRVSYCPESAQPSASTGMPRTPLLLLSHSRRSRSVALFSQRVHMCSFRLLCPIRAIDRLYLHLCLCPDATCGNIPYIVPRPD